MYESHMTLRRFDAREPSISEALQRESHANFIAQRF